MNEEEEDESGATATKVFIGDDNLLISHLGDSSAIWEQRSLKNKSLYNGKKFRYGGYVLHAGDGSDHEPHLCLHLGLTDYRTFVGTNLSPLWEKFLVPPEGKSLWLPCELLVFINKITNNLLFLSWKIEKLIKN